MSLFLLLFSAIALSIFLLATYLDFLEVQRRARDRRRDRQPLAQRGPPTVLILDFPDDPELEEPAPEFWAFGQFEAVVMRVVLGQESVELAFRTLDVRREN